MSNGYLANASQAAEKLSSEPFDSASRRSGRTAGVDCPALPFVLSVAPRAKSKHGRLFQQPARGETPVPSPEFCAKLQTEASDNVWTIHAHDRPRPPGR